MGDVFASAADGPTPALGEDTIILRRLLVSASGQPPTIDRPGVGLTATSFALKPRRDGEYPSWTVRVDDDSPKRLVELVFGQCNLRGSCVCAVSIGVVRSLGLDIEMDPTHEDANHCVMVPTARQPFTKTIWSTLAKKTRIVYVHTTE